MRCYKGLIICFWVCLAQAFYEPQGAMHYGYGRYRQIGRVQLLHPLSQQPNQLLYGHVIGLLDSGHACEGNFGLGYKVLKEDAIVGGYGFYDVRRTPYQNKMHQMTLGAEYLTLNYELRGNVYLPFSRSKSIAGQSILNTPNTRSVVLNQVETPLSGFDVEWSHHLPVLPLAQLTTGYYYFYASGVKSIQGPRFKLHYPLTPWLGVEGEWSYDKTRALHYFIGARLSFALASKSISSALVSKMTQMPIRDIDVVVQTYHWGEGHAEPAMVIATPAALQNIGSNIDGMTLDANYLLATDLDLSGFKNLIHPDGSKGFKPIGTKTRPFTGRFFGQGHTITGLFIESRKKMKVMEKDKHGKVVRREEAQFLGLFGYAKGTQEKPVLIENVHLIDVAIPGEGSGSYIGSLAGIVKQALVHHVSSQVYFNRYRYRCMGGLIGYMKKTRLEQAYSKSIIQGKRGTVGGLVGEVNHSYLAHVHGQISINYASFHERIGGLIGEMQDTELKQAYSEGYIKVEEGGSSIGGLVGHIRYFNNNSYLYRIYSTVDIQVKNAVHAHIGGLIGSGCGIKLKRAYHCGLIEVENGSNVGGLIGWVRKQHSICDVYSASPLDVGQAKNVGGLIGYMQGSNLQRAYSQGGIKVKKNGRFGDDTVVGGLIGLACNKQYAGLSKLDSSYLCNIYSTSSIHVGNFIRVGGLIAKACRIVLNRAYSAGSIQAGNYAWVGGLIYKMYSSYVHHAYSTCSIYVGSYSRAAGLVAHSSVDMLKQVYFFGTLNGPPDAIISLAIVQHGIKIKPSCGPYDAMSQVIDVNNFPGWFDEGNWMMGAKGPELTWPLKQDALLVLQQVNSLKLFNSIAQLPLELAMSIFANTQFYGALNTEQLGRLLYYARTPFAVEIAGKVRGLWDKEAFLNYVLSDSTLLPERQKRSSSGSLSAAAKRKRS